jgi:hypothetical protein
MLQTLADAYDAAVGVTAQQTALQDIVAWMMSQTKAQVETDIAALTNSQATKYFLTRVCDTNQKVLFTGE